MPIYEYVCEGCGKKFEVRQSIGQDGSALQCPSCGEQGPRRVFSKFACSVANDFGDYASLAGGGSSCSTCSSGNCATCGL